MTMHTATLHTYEARIIETRHLYITEDGETTPTDGEVARDDLERFDPTVDPWWYEEDVQEYDLYAPQVAWLIDVLRGEGATDQVSCSAFDPGGWYGSGWYTTSLATGEEGQTTVHPKGFAPHELAVAYEVVTGRSVIAEQRARMSRRPA